MNYQKAIINSINEGNGDIEIQIIESKKIIKTNTQNIMQMNRIHQIIDDLANMELLNNAEVLEHIRLRYFQDKIYCFCGPSLIMLNPYKIIKEEETEEL